MTDLPDLSLRLQAICDLIPMCSKIIDVGTDHAYIPITCVLNGIAAKGIAIDLREGPVENAMRNAVKYGVADKIRFSVSNGLKGIEVNEDDFVVISGLGGHEIISILSDYGQIRCGMILQPQKSAPELREYLCESGYEIKQEKIVKDRGKFYPVIKSVHTGEVSRLNELEKYVGKDILRRSDVRLREYGDDLINEYLQSLYASALKKAKGSHGFIELADRLAYLINRKKEVGISENKDQ